VKVPEGETVAIGDVVGTIDTEAAEEAPAPEKEMKVEEEKSAPREGVEMAEDVKGSPAAQPEAAVEAEAAKPLPTATLVPATALPTLTPVLPTATISVVEPPSGGGGSSGGGGGYTQYDYSCDIIRQRPQDNTNFLRTHTFDVTFTILNNGTKTWEAGKDLVLLGNPGHTLINPPGTIQLPRMKPGDTFTVGPFDAQAPDEPGHYVIDFKLEGGWCYPYVVFNVTR